MRYLKSRPEIGDIIQGHQVTEVRADGAVFGVKDGRLPAKEIKALKKHFEGGGKGFMFRPGYHFANLSAPLPRCIQM